MESQAALSPEPSRRRPAPLALLVAAAFFMEFLDGSIIATALPRMAPALHSTAVALNAGISAYLLSVAVFILPSGWAAERFGARRVFAGAILVFLAGSALCGLAQSAAWFVAARALQGAGGAMMVPVGRLAVLRTTPKHELMAAIALLTWPGLAAPVIAPPIGGFLAEYASWRWIFLLNLPLGLVAFPLALRLVPAGRLATRRRFDALGFGLGAASCIAALALVDGLGASGTPAWRTAAWAAGFVASGLALLGHLRRHPSPVIDLAPLTVRSFRAVMASGTAMRLLINSQPFLLPLLFQLALGMDAFHAGLLVLALFAGNLGIKPATSPILRRFGFRRTMLANGLLQAASMLACATLLPLGSLPLTLLVLVVSGASRSLHFTALNTLAFADVPERWMASANTMFSMAFQLSIGFGVAMAALLLRLGAGLAGTATPGLAAFRLAFCAIAAATALVALDAARLPRDAGHAVSRR